MKENLKKLAKYYKPYLGTFIIDMILAMMSAAVALVIPLVVRYITSKVAYMPADEASKAIFTIVVILFVLVLVQWGCNYYISNYGHVMGAKIEYDMRAETFLTTIRSFLIHSMMTRRLDSYYQELLRIYLI